MSSLVPCIITYLLEHFFSVAFFWGGGEQTITLVIGSLFPSTEWSFTSEVHQNPLFKSLFLSVKVLHHWRPCCSLSQSVSGESSESKFSSMFLNSTPWGCTALVCLPSMQVGWHPKLRRWSVGQWHGWYWQIRGHGFAVSFLHKLQKVIFLSSASDQHLQKIENLSSLFPCLPW